jgi:hypothetical protein
MMLTVDQKMKIEQETQRWLMGESKYTTLGKLLDALFSDDGTERTHISGHLFLQTSPETYTREDGYVVVRNPDDVGYEWWACVQVSEIPELVKILQDIHTRWENTKHE